MSEVIRFYDNNIGLVPKFPLFGLFKFCKGGGGDKAPLDMRPKTTYFPTLKTFQTLTSKSRILPHFKVVLVDPLTVVIPTVADEPPGHVTA